MCLILVAHEAHPRYRLVVAANRDEFYDRPTAPAEPWRDAPWVLAGRDLRSGGTWMGVTRTGRWAAVTNFRDPQEERRDARSRGELVGAYLLGQASPASYLRSVRDSAAEFNGFNLLVGEPGSLRWLSNRGPADGGDRELEPGVYGVSNHLLDTPWPKVERGKRALRELLASPDLAPGSLLDLLLDRTVAADHELPETGVGQERERMLSTLFIVSPLYGTRASTALLVDREGHAILVERTHQPGSGEWRERWYDFTLGAPAFAPPAPQWSTR